MTVSVSPTNKRNTHHVSLTDGVTEVPLILCETNGVENKYQYARRALPARAIKFTQGEQEYSDLEPPWTDIAQKDWGAGFGYPVFDENRAGYYDGYNVDTTGSGRAILGPTVGYATGARNWAGFWPSVINGESAGMVNLYGSVIYSQVYRVRRYVATPFTPSANFTAGHVWLWVKKPTSGADLILSIYTDVAGSPGVSLGAAVLTAASLEYEDRWYIKRILIAQNFVAGTTYWVVCDLGATEATRMYLLGAETGEWDKYSVDGTIWSYAPIPGPMDHWTRMYVRVTDAEKPFKAHFAILKNSLFTALEYLDYTDSKVFINGTQGTATAGNVAYLRDANNAAIVNDRFNGGRIYIWDGRGATLHRRITDTLTANSEIQVGTNFEVAPDTTSDYAVLDVDEFIEVTGIGAGSRVTDMLSVNGAIYFARGDGALIRRLRHFWTGAAYFTWTDEAINTTMLEAVTNGADVKIWAANRSLPAQIRVATGLDCTGTGAVAALTYGAAINVGDMEVKNTSILCAGESFPHLYVFKEDNIYEIVQDLPYELRIAALRSVRDGWNGVTSCVNDVYIYFNLGDRIQRYYKGQLDDITPVLPANRKGRPAAMLAYPGRLYVAYDGGESNYSTILCYNNNGWHEIYRAPDTGLRIMNMIVQPIPGAQNVDRLWFSCGSDICWLPLAIDPVRFNGTGSWDIDGYFYNHHPYTVMPFGYIETGWYYLGLRDLSKLFNAVTLTGMQTVYHATISGTSIEWKILRKIDNDLNLWYYVGSVFGSSFNSPTGENDLDANHNLTGIRIKFLIETDISNRNQSTNYGEINAFVLEALETIPFKYVKEIQFRVADFDMNLLGTEPDDMTGEAKKAKLREWGLSAGTVLMKGYNTELGGTGARVKVDPLGVRLVKNYQEQLRNEEVCQLTLYEVD